MNICGGQKLKKKKITASQMPLLLYYVVFISSHFESVALENLINPRDKT